MRKILRLITPILNAGGISVPIVLSDTFTTDLAAGSVNGSAAEPGPGLRTVVDTGNKLSLSSGSAAIAGLTTENVDPAISYAAVTRAAGVALFAAVQYPLASARLSWGFGIQEYYRIAGSGFGANFTFNFAAAAHATEYKTIIVLRSTGAFYIASGGAIGADYKLVRVSAADSTASFAPSFRISDIDSASNCREIKVGTLAGPWATAYGPGALHTSGAIAASTAFTHEGNALIYFTLTSNGTAGDTVIKFRVQDANNYWKLTISNDGSADLSEVVSGSATSRGTAAAGVFADGERCSILANGTDIRIYDGAAIRITYASATNFATATAGEVTSLATDAVLSNLEIYPVDMSGAALEWLTALELG